jgi:hypothetical protein
MDRPTRTTAAPVVGVLLALVGSAVLAWTAGPTAGASEGNNDAPRARATHGQGITAQPGQRPPTRGPVGVDPSTRATVPLNLVGGLIDGTPIFPGDFADPYILAENSGLFAYATNTVDANIPVVEIQSGNILNGDYLGDALPKLPSWTVKGFQWAPSVWARPDGRFVMYYSTAAPPNADGSPRRQCVTRAVADAPAGPFTDNSSSPFICPLTEGGAIDPSIFLVGTTPYLLWKADGNCCGLPTTIYSQQLSADGLSTAGPPTALITADQGWEGGVVEGPSMVKAGKVFDLFYSANNWDSSGYSVGIAECTSVEGPCTKPLSKPWMVSAQGYSGPGGQEFFLNPGGVWMVHHGFLPGQAGTPDGQRRLYMDLLDFTGTNPIPARIGAKEAEGKVLQLLVEVAAVSAVVIGGLVLFRRRRRKRRGGGDDTPTGGGSPSEERDVAVPAG